MLNANVQSNMYGNSNSFTESEKEEDYQNRRYNGYIPTILTVDVLGLRNKMGQYNIHDKDNSDDDPVCGSIENDEPEYDRSENVIASEDTLEIRQNNLPSVINNSCKTETSNETSITSKTTDGISGLIKSKFIGSTITEHFVNNLAITGEVIFSSEEIYALKDGDTICFINTDYAVSFE